MAKQFHVSYKRVLIGATAALIANIILYLIGGAAAATWQVGLPFTVSLAMVAFATVFPMLLGGFIVGILAKWKPGIVGLASWLVLVFALAGSPSGYIASQDLATGLALGAMHLVVGLSWFIGIRAKK